MFPYKDENPTEFTPFFTVALIIANVAVWVFVQGMGSDLQPSVCHYGLIPVELTGRVLQGPSVCPLGGLTWGSVFTSMFMHGSWIHLGANMMFMWVFGNNIEDSMGHLRFVLFYLLCGLAAAGAHVGFNASSGLPTVGASGAISGILGAYIVLYPQVRVHVYFPPFWILPMRAYVVLGYWIVIQILMGLAERGGGGAAGGVAVWAHIGGFFAGLILVKFFERPQLVGAKREGVRLDKREIRQRHIWW
ncbi:MAG: rhomboid family intramembrane serine protease [Gemmatimonadota bacterium]|nr:MAG: rhomboid family intramembrane serine protease [Gemmatimonadota bacterium]